MCNKLIYFFYFGSVINKQKPTMSSKQLRTDPSDGKPYTHESFIETYIDGQAIWDRAEVWSASDGVLRVRTVPISKPVEHVTQAKSATYGSPPTWDNADFPTIGDVAETSVIASGMHYSRVVTPEKMSMSPDAPEFMPGAENNLTLKYSENEHSTNEDFETLPAALWNGNESFVQPITDDENGVVDWDKMIQTWTKEQWTEFGIKFFYGYVQQSSILMGHMHQSSSDDKPLGSWGDE